MLCAMVLSAWFLVTWKDILRSLETGPLAEIGLLAFFIAFILILLYVYWMPKDFREHARHMPLEDDTPPHKNGSSS